MGSARRRASIVAPALGVLVFAGCQDPLRRSVPESRLVRSQKYQVITDIEVPTVESPRACGPQALAAVMAFLDPAVSAQDLYESLPIRGQPTTPIELLLVARTGGYGATVSKGTWQTLKDRLDQGMPSLVMFDRAPSGWPLPGRPPKRHSYHWGVVSGMSRTGDEILLAAPSHKHHVLPRPDFERRWSVPANCTVTIDPKGKSQVTQGSPRGGGEGAAPGDPPTDPREHLPGRR